MKKKALFSVCLAGTVMLILLVWLMDFPSWQKLDMDKLTDLNQMTVLYDAEGRKAACLSGGEKRTLVEISDVPEAVKNAFIAIEDMRFYSHPGVDVRRIAGALLANLKAGGYREGASTITQQLIKLTHLTGEKTIARKAQEAWLALQLERQAEKDDILEMYLNAVYFGRGAYGIEAASQAYFGKECGELTLAEGAMLAGLIKAPGVYAPHIDRQKAVERRNTVIRAMEKAEMIDGATAKEAMAEEVRLIEAEPDEQGWYADWVLQEAAEALDCPVEEILGGGLKIYTGYCPKAQAAADELFADASFFPEDAQDGTRAEAALIALNPDNGEIVCMVGGRNYEVRRGLNRSVQIKRQPGSALKPICVYAAAVDLLGYTPVSLIEDRSRDFGGGYTPSNASGKEYGTVTLKRALARSMNLAAVDLITRTGAEAAALYARRAGLPLTQSDCNLSLALGSMTEGVSPAQLCAAYAPLVNGGRRVSGHAIRRIDDAYGRTLYEFREEGGYVMSEKSARMITGMLEEAVSSGTAGELSGIGFPVAAKTGTVGHRGGGNTDAWTVAYTPGVTVCVWMGFDRPDENRLPEGTTGGTCPARLAAAFMKETESISDGGDFRMPQGMTETLLDAKALDDLRTPMLAAERTPSRFLLKELLPDEEVPVLTSPLWGEPARVEALFIGRDLSGAPEVSFVVPDSYSTYRLIRRRDGLEEEIARLEGSAGEYVSFTDVGEEAAEYYVISRHKGFEACGEIVESEPSETVVFRERSALEKMIGRMEAAEETERPLFASDPTENQAEPVD